MKIESRRTAQQPPWHSDQPSSGRQVRYDGWQVRLTLRGRTLSVPFWKGEGHGGEPPHREEVLEALASDAAFIENAKDFWDWAEELGMAPTRATEKQYRAGVEQTKKFKAFLGDLYQSTVYGEDVDG
jgi:hypothetical protein